MLTKEDVMNKLEEIREALNVYKQEALVEYSQLETDRHNHFTYEEKDGSHPDAIKFWKDELQKHVGKGGNVIPTKQLVNDILKRAPKSLRDFYATLKSDTDLVNFTTLLIKAEALIMSTDYRRAKEYFDFDYQLEQEKSKQSEDRLLQTLSANLRVAAPAADETDEGFIERQKAKFRSKTKEELFEAYLASPFVANRTNELDKIRLAIVTLLQSSEHKYLIDYEINDYDVFFDTLLYTPKAINKCKKIFEDYDGNFVAIADDFKNDQIEETYHYDELDFQSKKTLVEKLGAVKNFITYCIEEAKALDKNVLTMRRYDTSRFNNIATESKERAPFNTEEIVKMFSLMIENKIFNQNLAHFYIPLIAIFAGLRVEEICKLRSIDIIQEDKIDCISVRGAVKTKNSVRKVPIHRYLIDKFNFLEYVESRKNCEMLFDLRPIVLKSKTKYSHEYVQDFMLFRNEFVSEDRIVENLISFHSFRHLFGTRLDDNGVSETTISRLMGHSIRGNETSRYTHSGLKKLYDNVNMIKMDDLDKSINSLSVHFKKHVKF